MFFDDDRIVAMREMILADTEAGRRTALDKLLPMQRADFVELFEIMEGLPVTIRLLDPPLHEFLPQDRGGDRRSGGGDGGRAGEAAPAHATRCTSSTRCSAIAAAGLPISYPEIAEMQARAIFEAAIEAGEKTGEADRAGDHGAAGRR